MAVPTKQFLVEASYFEVRHGWVGVGGGGGGRCMPPSSPRTLAPQCCVVWCVLWVLGWVCTVAASRVCWLVFCALCQIYNEVIYDLLDPGKKKAGRASLDIKVGV
jgi:hypothetical protein